MIPEPGFRIDRLAHAAQQTQRLAGRGLYRSLPVAHQGADRGGGGVEDIDLVLVHHLPEAAAVGIVWNPLEHQRGGAIGQRAIDDIGVPGHPADIGGAPVDVAWLVVEHHLMRVAGPDHVAAGGVQHALRLAGAARGVKDEQRVLGAELRGRAIGRRGGAERCEIMIPTRLHCHVAAGHLHDDHVLDGRALFERRVGIGLQRNRPPTAAALVGGDQHVGVAVLDAVGQAVRGEPAEHHGMDGADPCAGQHGGRSFRHHRHIDGDPVALLHAQALHRVGEAAHLLMQLTIGHMEADIRVVAFPDDRRLIAPRRQMAVQAGDGGVQGSVLEPFDRDIALEAGVLDLGRRLHPGDAGRFLAPIAVGIGCGLFRQRLIPGRVHMSLRREVRQYGENLGERRGGL